MKNEFEGPVSDWMVSPVFSLRQETPLAEAAQELESRGMSALPVLDVNSRLTGLFSSSDLVRAGRYVNENPDRERHLRLPKACVGDFMNTRVPVVRPDSSLGACARRMLKHGLHRLYVAEDGPIVGVVSTREMLSAVVRARIETPIAKFANRAIASASARDSLASAMARLRADTALTLVVLEGAEPVGVFSRAHALVAREAEPTEAVELWMDRNVLSLPAEMPAYIAAQQLHDLERRYIVAREGQTVIGIVSGLAFTEIVGTEIVGGRADA